MLQGIVLLLSLLKQNFIYLKRQLVPAAVVVC